MTILHEINDGPGFCLEELAPAELELVRGIITEQYLERIGELQPELVPRARERGIARYHTLPIAFDHGKSWPKQSRLLDAKYVSAFSRMGFFRRIRRQIGPSAVISHDELNWRLVRPNQPGDIGPIHADKWFWDAGYGYGSMPEGFDRFKVWMAIHTEPGSNGLCVKPNSHRREWRHHFEDEGRCQQAGLRRGPECAGDGTASVGRGTDGDVPRRTAPRRRRESRVDSAGSASNSPCCSTARTPSGRWPVSAATPRRLLEPRCTDPAGRPGPMLLHKLRAAGHLAWLLVWGNVRAVGRGMREGSRSGLRRAAPGNRSTCGWDSSRVYSFAASSG